MEPYRTTACRVTGSAREVWAGRVEAERQTLRGVQRKISGRWPSG